MHCKIKSGQIHSNTTKFNIIGVTPQKKSIPNLFRYLLRTLRKYKFNLLPNGKLNLNPISLVFYI